MKLHYLGTRSEEEFGKFPRTQLVNVGDLSIFCDYYDHDHKITEPSIWVPVNNRYDVWQLIGEAVIGDSTTEKHLKKLCVRLIESLYNNGFSSGSFQS